MVLKSQRKEEAVLRQRTVGALLKSARIKSGLTQSQIAKTLGYGSSQFVSNWERGEALPPMEHFPKLASLLKINIGELIDCIHHYQDEFLRLEKRRIIELFRPRRSSKRR